MAPRNNRSGRTPSPGVQQPVPRRPSYMQRMVERVSTPLPWQEFWRNVRRRDTANQASTPMEPSLARISPSADQNRRQEPDSDVPFMMRIAQIGQRLSTPIQTPRPRTAPNPNSAVVFRPINWEDHRENGQTSPVSSSGLEARCPYDPAVLQSFPSIEPSVSNCGMPLPWAKRERIPTPCSDCLNGTERAHINVSPSRFFRNRLGPRPRTRSGIDSENDNSSPNRPVQHVDPTLLNSSPRTARTPQSPLSRLQRASNTPLPERPPERMGHRRDPEELRVFNNLKGVVESNSNRLGSSPLRPRSTPRLHYLSPDVAFIHRHEVAAHQAAIREGRYSPLLAHQILADSDLKVVGYNYYPGRRDTSTTVLYSTSHIPGEYIPPLPREIPTPTQVLSAFRRRPISIAPVERPVLIPRLDQPPFVPALPEGTIILPVSQWTRSRSSRSAPANFERVLRHSAVYRTRNSNHRPRIPSPLHEVHNAASSADNESEWSHGTMPPDPLDTEEPRHNRVNGYGPSLKSRMRGGGAEEYQMKTPMERMVASTQHSTRCNPYRGGRMGTISYAQPPPKRYYEFPEDTHLRTRCNLRNSKGHVYIPRTDNLPPVRLSRSRHKSPTKQPISTCPKIYPTNHTPKRYAGSRYSVAAYRPTTYNPSVRVLSLPSPPQSPSTPPSQIPRLRGGGRPNHRPDRIPASLFYLAGGTRWPGKTTTVEQWNKQKPKKRMGGLLGMAVYGFKSGKPYDTQGPPGAPGVDSLSGDVDQKQDAAAAPKAASGTPEAPPGPSDADAGSAAPSPPNDTPAPAPASTPAQAPTPAPSPLPDDPPAPTPNDPPNISSR